jgi:RNA polymerase sigma-70 factor (ECF subfamily)
MTKSLPAVLQESEPDGADIASDQKKSDDAPEPRPCLDHATHAYVQAPDLDTTRTAGASALLLQHYDVLERVALRLCGNHADAHDLVQDTLERALRACNTKVPENPRAWLLTIMHNLFIHQLRWRSRRPLVPLQAEHLDIPEPDPEVEPEWASISPAQLEAALSQLDERFRQVYELHCQSHASYDEIAAVLGIPKNTVGTRLTRARRKVCSLLRAQLAGCSANENRDS